MSDGGFIKAQRFVNVSLTPPSIHLILYPFGTISTQLALCSPIHMPELQSLKVALRPYILFDSPVKLCIHRSTPHRLIMGAHPSPLSLQSAGGLFPLSLSSCPSPSPSLSLDSSPALCSLTLLVYLHCTSIPAISVISSPQASILSKSLYRSIPPSLQLLKSDFKGDQQLWTLPN